MIYQVLSKGFVKQLRKKAHKTEVLDKNLTKFNFIFNSMNIVVMLMEDDESYHPYIQVESTFIKLLEHYLGFRYDKSQNWTSYRYPLITNSAVEALKEVDRYKQLTDHTEDVYPLLSLLNGEIGYWDYQGKEYLYHKVDDNIYYELIVK